MSTQDKKIPVYLVQRNPIYSEVVRALGEISAANLAQIQTVFETAEPGESTCMRRICMNYEVNQCTKYGFANRGGETSHSRRIELSGASWIYSIESPICQDCTGKTDIEKMRVCSYNLRTGRCCDPLIRRTFGAVLFPALYAKDKQK